MGHGDVRLRDGRRDDAIRDYRDDAWGMPKSIVIDPAFDWGTDQLPRTPLHRSIIYEAHVKGFSIQNPDVPEAERGTYAGLGSEPSIKYLKELGITAIELLPVHQHVEDQHLDREEARQLLGLQHDQLFRAAPQLCRQRAGQRERERVQADGQEPARGGDRGHHRRGVQPYGGGQPPRADSLFQGHRQPYVLPADARRSTLLHGFHGLRQLAQRAAPDRVAHDRRFPALLGDGDARRWVPLRPRGDAGARRERHQQIFGVPGDHPSGPGVESGQADRRAVGHRHGRLSGGQFSGAVDRVERALPRHGAQILEGRRFADRRVRVPHQRFVGPVPDERQAALRQHQFHHQPRRLFAQRSRQLQRQAQRGQRREQQRRRQQQPLLELRRGRSDRRREDQRVAPTPAAQFSGDVAAEPGRADAAGRRRIRTHPVRQQQRVLPGRRNFVAGLEARQARAAASLVHAGVDQAAQRRIRCSGGPSSFRAARFAGRT